jgi:hypothetical protein
MEGEYNQNSSSIIKVYRIVGLKREESEIDYRLTSWKKADGLWEDPQGWIPKDKEDAEAVGLYTKQRLKKAQERQQEEEDRFHRPHLYKEETSHSNEENENDQEDLHEQTKEQADTQPPHKHTKLSKSYNKENLVELAETAKTTELSEPVTATPLSSLKNDIWRDVLKEQNKVSNLARKEQELAKRAEFRRLEALREEHNRQEIKRKWTKRIVLGLTLSICIAGTAFYIAYAPKNKNLFTEQTSGGSKEDNSFWSMFTTNDHPKASIPDNTKLHILRYTIEEAIWSAKVKASLHSNKTGQTNWDSIAQHLDFDASLSKVLPQVEKLYREAKNKTTEINRDDFKEELTILRSLAAASEKDALKRIGEMTKRTNITLGTYPHKNISQKANREKWVSPLGKLYSDVSARDQRTRFITTPNDPRSVGIPMKWDNRE